MTDAPPTAFLSSTGAPARHKIARLPFDQAWRDPKAEIGQYTQVFIKPVSLSYLRTEHWTESASMQMASREAYLQEAKAVAAHWDESLRRAFSDPQSRFRLANDAHAPGTVVLEIALTEVVFSHPETYVASMAVTAGGVAESAFLAPTTAFEAKVIDGPTGKLLATVADRTGTRIKVIDFNRLSVSKANMEICDDWAVELMQAANRDLFPVVKRKMFSVF